MPWREICPMDEKLRFVAAVLSGEPSMTELCASFGVSRKTGYKWLLRYQRHRIEGLHELSRAPHRVPWAIAQHEAQAVLEVRRAHPSPGAEEAACGAVPAALRTSSGPRPAPSVNRCAARG